MEKIYSITTRPYKIFYVPFKKNAAICVRVVFPIFGKQIVKIEREDVFLSADMQF